MARVFDPNQKTGTIQQPVLATGMGASTSTPSQSNPVASGRFTNVQKFIKANRPDQFAGQVAGKIGSKVEGVKQNIGKSQQAFEQAAQQGRVDTAQNIQAVQNIYNPESSGQFANVLKSQGYTGPKQLENQDVLTSQARQTQLLGANLGTNIGKSQVLQQLYNRPSYSAGQKQLDTLLLGQDKSKALQQARAKSSGLEGYATQAGALSEQRANELAKQGENLINQAKEKYSQETFALGKDVGGRAQNVSTQRAKELQEVKDEAARGRLSIDDLKSLGLSEGDMLYVMPQSFIRNGQTEVSAGDVATNEERARAQVLANIADQSGISPEQMGTIRNIISAQTSKPGSLYDINKTGFINANEAAKAKYQADTTELQNTQQQVQNLGKTLENLNQGSVKVYLGRSGNVDIPLNELDRYLNTEAYRDKLMNNPQVQNYLNIKNNYNQALNDYNRRNSSYAQNWGNLRQVVRR